MFWNAALAAAAFAICAVVVPKEAQAVDVRLYPTPWGTGGPDGWDEAYQKAREFVTGLTLVEKVNLTTGTGWEADRCIGMTGGVPRLNFSGLCLEDSPLGVRYGLLTSAFPAGINTAATWSRDLTHRRGVALGQEFRGKGIDIELGPVVGPLGLFPQGGRNWEGFSPDPYLAGVSVGQTVTGIQGSGTIACAKHYIMNEQEHYRNDISAEISDKAMHEVYLWPFADAVRAGVGAIMCSYNKINGSFSCENGWTSNYLLKNELNFQGFVMSDWGAQHTTVGSALAGLDMTMPGDGAFGPYNSLWGGALTAAVINGTIPQWRLDDMVIRIMAAYYKVHVGNNTDRVEINMSAWTNQTYGPVYFASNRSYGLVNEHVNVQADHKDVIREIGAKSIVLLKNVNGTLPLKAPKSLAVIGEDAQDNPAGPNACPDRGCDEDTLAMGYGSGTANFPYLISPATALLERANANGTQFTNVSSNYDLDAAATAAAAAEVAIVFANADSGEGYITIGGNTGDRNNLTLWEGGDALIAAVAGANNNTVVVLHTVGPVIIETYKNHPNITAILWAGLPGQESGNSLVDVLYGATNPQGRSPFTWGKQASDWGVSILLNSPNAFNPEETIPGSLIDYRYFDKHNITPSYEFGFGLSYTTFAYSNLTVVGQTVAPYTASTGETDAAPLYGSIDTNVSSNTMPAGFDAVPNYVYSWVNSKAPTGASASAQIPEGGLDASPQPVPPAGGAPGGNPGLYEVMYVVSVNVTNTGPVAGTEIAQLYLGSDDPDPTEPVRVLRGFEEVPLNPSESRQVSFNLTYRDLANWDTPSQNWVLTQFNKTIFVGASSRDLQLSYALPL